MARIQRLVLLAAAAVAVLLAVAAGIAAQTPPDVRADYTAVVKADHAALTAGSDVDRYRESLDALSLRDTFTARHAKAGWRITDDNRLAAPASRSRAVTGLGAGAGLLAVATVAAAFLLHRRSTGAADAPHHSAAADG